MHTVSLHSATPSATVTITILQSIGHGHEISSLYHVVTHTNFDTYNTLVSGA